MRANNQGGSLAGFIIVGILLALVLVGGLYGLNRYNASRGVDVASNNSSEKKDAKNGGDSTADGAKNSDANKTDESQPDGPSKPVTDPGDATPQPAANSTNTSTGAAKSAALPTTGPTSTLYQLIVASALSFALVHYARSRSRA